jgi:uncharacterized protein (DUF885 family)
VSSHCNRAGTLVIALIAIVSGNDARAADTDRVTALADRYVEAYKSSFPIGYELFGLPLERSDGIDINGPAAIERWHRLNEEMASELATIRPEGLVGHAEWVTWQFLNQALSQDRSTAVCRSELWGVSPGGWQTGLKLIADAQPVATDQARAQALTRWRGFGPWIDREIANLKEGQKLGYTAAEPAVRSTLAQLDELLAGPPEKSAFMDVPQRASSEAFTSEWRKAIAESLWPALARYRDYLRDQYAAGARKTPSIAAQPGGRECYRALIFSTVTIDADPDALFDKATREIERERAAAIELGRKIYGDKATDWATLSKLMREDPREKFASSDEIRDYTQRTYERAYAAANKMLLTPPKAQVKLEPFPEFQQKSAPGGQYLPAADDGSRIATYYYRNVPGDLYRSSLQNVILHETLPGHHLQLAFLAEHGRKGNHPISRVLFFSGPGEGWATYAETFAYELGLYDSDRDYIGQYMGSITPMMVVDLGMQVKGWTPEQAEKYLIEAMPLRPASRARESIATISSIPGFVLAYPLGGMEWQAMRDRAQAQLGRKFDVRAFHQALLEDGMLPFSALNAKLDRWIAAGGH